MAVDCSGESGAPCLLMLVDKITGGKSKVWAWRLGSGVSKIGKAEDGHPADTTVEGNAFTIRKPDGATLRGTFVVPGDVKVTAEVKQTEMIGGGGRSSGKTLERPIPGVSATGGTDGRNGDFFVAVTMQRGDRPAVTVEGSGLNARVTVGKQVIAFDGKKVFVGK